MIYFIFRDEEGSLKGFTPNDLRYSVPNLLIFELVLGRSHFECSI